MTTVVNKYKDKFTVYIGRGTNNRIGYFGNPHPIGYCDICNREHDREDCLGEYKKYFIDRIEKDADFKRRILLLKNQTLGCFCKPKACHGDIIAEYLNEHSSQPK